MAQPEFYIGPEDLNYVAREYHVVLEYAIQYVNNQQPNMTNDRRSEYARQLAAEWHARMVRKQEAARKKRLGL